MLTMADSQIVGIAGAVSCCEKRKLPSSFLANLVHSLAYPRFASRVHEDDRKFTVSESCTSCGICSAICPAENINLVEGNLSGSTAVSSAAGAFISARLKRSRRDPVPYPNNATGTRRSA